MLCSWVTYDLGKQSAVGYFFYSEIYFAPPPINVIEENEECFRKVENITVFYMPHAPYNLYNNLLYSNWNPSSLAKVIIIGNDFNLCAKMCGGYNLDFRRQYKFIHAAIENNMFSFNPIELSESLTNVWNDQSVTVFPSDTLPPSDHCCWKLADEKPLPDFDEVEPNEQPYIITV